MAERPQEVFDHQIEAVVESERDGYGWIDFCWNSEVEAEAENLKEAINEWLENESRHIEVFSVIDEAGKVVLTEEDFV